MRVVADVLAERPCAELVFRSFLEHEHIIARVGDTDRVFAHIKADRLWRRYREARRELVEAVRESFADLRVHPLRIAGGKYLLRVRERRPHPGVGLSVEVAAPDRRLRVERIGEPVAVRIEGRDAREAKRNPVVVAVCDKRVCARPDAVSDGPSRCWCRTTHRVVSVRVVELAFRVALHPERHIHRGQRRIDRKIAHIDSVRLIPRKDHLVRERRRAQAYVRKESDVSELDHVIHDAVGRHGVEVQSASPRRFPRPHVGVASEHRHAPLGKARQSEHDSLRRIAPVNRKRPDAGLRRETDMSVKRRVYGTVDSAVHCDGRVQIDIEIRAVACVGPSNVIP